MKTIKIIFFGDSICFGQGISIYKGWVPRIAAKLDEIYTNKSKIVVTNASVNGSTTRLGLERMPYEVQSQNPDILLIQFGMNDCNHWDSDRGLPRVSPKSFIANIEEMIARAFNFSCQFIVLNTNHTTLRNQTLMNTKITYEQSNKYYNGLIRSVADQHDNKVVLNDIEYAVNDFISNGGKLEQLLQSDLLHLEEKGHDLYYEVTLPIISSLVDRIFLA